MAEIQWVRGEVVNTTTSNDLPPTETTILSNLPEGSRYTIVDGIMTMITDNEDLWIVRLLHMPEIVGVADVDAANPDFNDRMNYYFWYAARGPVVFRLRAKRTLQDEETLRLQVFKRTGSVSATLNVGYQIAYVLH